jgi:hypothetical protein
MDFFKSTARPVMLDVRTGACPRLSLDSVLVVHNPDGALCRG